MTCLTFTDIFINAMHFNDENGLLYKTCSQFCPKFKENSIRYYIVGGYALIHHQVVRNTMDVDIIVHAHDFEEAISILYDVGYEKILGDGLCARLQHKHLLAVDILVSSVYGPDPSNINTIECKNNIMFCDLPTLLLTKIQAYVGRPLTAQMRWKHMMDHADICQLIVIHDLKQDFAKSNNFNYVMQSIYERIHSNYYNEIIKSKSEKKKSLCICQ